MLDLNPRSSISPLASKGVTTGVYKPEKSRFMRRLLYVFAPRSLQEQIGSKHHGENRDGRRQQPRKTRNYIQIGGVSEHRPPCRELFGEAEPDIRQRRLRED